MCKKRRLEAQYCGREGQLTPGPRRKTWLDAIGIYPRHGAKERRGLFFEAAIDEQLSRYVLSCVGEFSGND